LGSYKNARDLGIGSIVTLGALSALVARVAWSEQNPPSRAVTVVLWAVLVALSINVVANLLGKTWFEKLAMTVICFTQITAVASILTPEAVAGEPLALA
jgi:hypothetical protein